MNSMKGTYIIMQLRSKVRLIGYNYFINNFEGDYYVHTYKFILLINNLFNFH